MKEAVVQHLSYKKTGYCHIDYAETEVLSSKLHNGLLAYNLALQMDKTF